jgi:hypothetical protein
MSGQLAAVAAYNGSGTQGYGTTDEYVPGVKSVFWNEKDTDKYYVNGSAVSEVPANTNTIKSAETIVFTLDNDSDAVSDLKLSVQADKITAAADAVSYFMAYFIERVEICLGNQVISTMNTTTLIQNFIQNKTSFSTLNATPAWRDTRTGALQFTSSSGVAVTTANQTWGTVFSLPIFNIVSNDIKDSYLMACANNQTLQVKVYPFNLTTADLQNFYDPSQNPCSIDGDCNFTFNLYATKTTVTNSERNFLRNQVLPKRTLMTQVSSNYTTSQKDGNTLKAGGVITINCDFFNLFTSEIYIVADCAVNDYPTLEVELVLNSTSYSGSLTPAKMIDEFPPALRYVGNTYYFKLNLGETLMSTDQNFVPLSRYDSIKIKLTNYTSTDIASFTGFWKTLSAVAVGKCTALYQNGAVTFNNY